MRQCSQVVALLLDFLEQRLPRETATELEVHLGRCPACVAYLNTYRSTVALLGSITEADLPPELRASLRAFLDDRERN